MRTFAIVAMVQVHFIENLSGYRGWVVAGFAAPIFTFLTGVSYRLWADRQSERGRDDEWISKSTVRRAFFLFGVGFLFNVLVWLPQDTFNWDVLTFIGAAIGSLAWLRRVPSFVPLLMSVAIFGISPVLRHLTDYASYWPDDYFECDLELSEVTLGFLVNGFFPVFPWMIYPWVGYRLAPVIFGTESSVEERHWWPALLGAGLLAISLSLQAIVWLDLPEGLQRFGDSWTMFPASASYVSGTLGGTLLAAVLLHHYLDVPGRLASDGIVMRIITTFSPYSLSIYLLHHIVHLWPLWWYGMQYGNEPTQYWRTFTTAPISLALSTAFIVACYPLFRIIRRYQWPTLESAMRWFAD